MNVKAALGPSLSIPDTEIQEALWHYYFEVAKAVTYLRSQTRSKSTSA
jgi:elongation factor 1 alpha-like protein